MQDRIRQMTDEFNETQEERDLHLVDQEHQISVLEETVKDLEIKMKRRMSGGLRLLLKINGHLQQYAVFEFIAHNSAEASKYKTLYEAEKAQAEAQGYEFGVNPETGRFIIIKEPEEDLIFKEAKIVDIEKAKKIATAYFDELLLEANKDQFQIQEQFNYAVSNQKYADIATQGNRLDTVQYRITLIEQHREGVVEALNQL